MPDTDTIFVARFIANNVIVSNKLLGYTEDENNQITFTYSDVNVTSTATPSISGSTITYTMPANNTYIFAGWWDSINNERALVSGETISYTCSLEAPVSTKYIYALWINPNLVSAYANYTNVDGLDITKSFGLVTDGITVTATTNNQDYNWVGWYHNESTLYDSGNNVLTLSYAQTFEKLVTMTSVTGIAISYDARWNISGIVVEVSETLGNGLGSVSKTKTGNTWTITATPDAGYLFDHWEHEGSTYSTNATVNNVPTDSGTYYAYFTARNDVDYTSNTKLQNYANNNYTDTTTVIPNNTTNTKVYISAPATPEGYELANVKVNGVNASPIAEGTNAGKYELTILGDGSSHIDFYFNLKTIDITYHYNDGTASSTVTEKYNTSTSSYQLGNYELDNDANRTWYSDINLTTQVTTLDINATNTRLYACYDGNNNLSTKFDLTEMTGYYKVGIKDGSFTSSTDIVIPNYINDVPVTTVNVDELYGQSYNSITMPTGLQFIEYGTDVNGSTITWIVLESNNGTFKLISKNSIDNHEFDDDGAFTNYNDAEIKAHVESLVTLYNSDTISLLSETEFNTYSSILNNYRLSENWWLSTIYEDPLMAEDPLLGQSILYVNSSNSVGTDGYLILYYIEPLAIRPTITITL